MTTPADARLRKMFLTIVDDRTTLVCLAAAGQVVDVEDDFTTLAGDYFAPPCHIHCRSVAIPVLDEVVTAQQSAAAAELARRGHPEPGRLPPPAKAEAPHQIMRPRPGWTPTPQRRWQAPSGLVAAAHADSLTEWLPRMMWLHRRREGLADPFPGDTRAGGPSLFDRFADRTLSDIAAVQGFDGPPRLATPAEVERQASAAGWPVLWRGVDTREQAERLATGPARYGVGILGAGLYFTRDPDTAARFAGTTGTTVEATLQPGARVITWGELETLAKTTRDGLAASQARRLDLLLRDPGRFAAAMGYDAVILPDGDMLVLNRTALLLAWGAS